MTAVPQAPAVPPPAPPPGAVSPGGTPPPPARAAQAAVRRRTAAKPPTGVARLLPRTVAGRVRALTGLTGIVLAAVLVIVWVAIGNARDGVRVIGDDAGPQVVKTSRLYYKLTEMDAQLANALLIGRPQGPVDERKKALDGFDDNRRQAGAALLEASRLADEDTEKKTAQDLLDALGRYEWLAGQAILLDQGSPDARPTHAAGPPKLPVIKRYRQATELMKLDLLPKAYNLTLDNGTLVRHTYEAKRGAVQTGQVWTLVIGLLLLAILVGFQVFLTARFRRLLNPALALATVGTLVLVGASWAVLAGQADHLRKAKEDGFDSILALWRARSISNSANADRTRYLIDPELADTYEQVYFSKSQTVLYLKAESLTAYNQALQGLRPGKDEQLPIKGFLKNEEAHSSLPEQHAAFLKVINDYRAFQQSDRDLRNLVESEERLSSPTAARTKAVASRSAAADDFAAYDRSMQKLINIHDGAFTGAVDAAKGGTGGWHAVLPVAGLVIFALVLIGVRPRLTEYR
ncbi:hypothetical protein [Spirillospora sp. NBC_01491]|uniref:hypothetical protein n=1 Tax=Spirillospora sp. NBC_01491 TaxID=2976007 RepID=UPI002E30F4F3|nr:hypothetical protein [Spirillospora sp. NBC_01491]